MKEATEALSRVRLLLPSLDWKKVGMERPRMSRGRQMLQVALRGYALGRGLI